MKSSWKIAALVSCVIPICGAAITRHLVKARADQRKLSEDANVYRARAEQGDAEAQFNLARAYYHGQGVPQDYNGAARWYRKAADQGYAKAEYDLGYMYYKGKGVPQDYSEALLWYRKAADQGYANAQYAVGYMYFQGKGVPQDHAEAARWYRRAANQGDEYAQRALGSTRMGFTTWSKINLSIVFLGSTLLLIDSRGSIRSRIQRRTTQTGLLGLLWVGLDAFEYSSLGIVQSASVVSALYVGRHLLAGICVAMLGSIAWPRGTKTVLGISVILFVAFDLFALAHYDLRHLVPAIRLFYLVNGLSVGVAIPSAVFLWLQRKDRGKRQ